MISVIGTNKINPAKQIRLAGLFYYYFFDLPNLFPKTFDSIFQKFYN